VQGHDGFHLCFSTEHTALEFEVFKAVTRLRSLGQAHHGLGGEGFFVAQTLPCVVCVGLAAVGQVGLLAIPQVKQIAQHLHPIALLPISQQGRHRHAQKLAQQVEQSTFNRRHGVDGHPQVKGLIPAPAVVQAGKAFAQAVEQAVPVANGTALDQAARRLQGAADFFPTRHLAHTGASRAVCQDHQIAGEKGAVRTAQVEQHAVVPGHGNDTHVFDHRRARCGWRQGWGGQGRQGHGCIRHRTSWSV